MHYYQFNIADYRKDTMHLSRLEHGIYRDLIDWYYLDEQPIPLETQSVSRRLRLVSEEEAKALKNVLSDFFTLSDDGYRHSRIDAEIANYSATCDKNKENGKKGGRPKAIKPLNGKEDNPIGSESVTTGNPNETQINPNQEPITNNHKPSKPFVSREKIAFDGSNFKNTESYIEGWGKAYPAIDVTIELNKASVWLIANPQNKKSNYARFLNNWLCKAQDKAPKVSSTTVSIGKPWFLTSTGIENKAESLGLYMKNGEAFPYFKQRVYQAAGVTPDMLRSAQADFGAKG